MTVKASLVTETSASRDEVPADDGSLFGAWTSIARSRGLEGTDDGVGFSHAVADGHLGTGRLALFGDVVAARTASGDVGFDAARFEFTDAQGRLWECWIEFTDSDFDPEMERRRQMVPAIERQVRRLFPARSRVGVLELASPWSLFQTTVKVPRLSGRVLVRLARGSMHEPSEAVEWGECVNAHDNQHRWYFKNDGMDEQSFEALLRDAKTHLL